MRDARGGSCVLLHPLLACCRQGVSCAVGVVCWRGVPSLLFCFSSWIVLAVASPRCASRHRSMGVECGCCRFGAFRSPTFPKFALSSLHVCQPLQSFVLHTPCCALLNRGEGGGIPHCTFFFFFGARALLHRLTMWVRLSFIACLSGVESRLLSSELCDGTSPCTVVCCNSPTFPGLRL